MNIMNITNSKIDPLSIEKLPEHKAREYFKLSADWMAKIRFHNPEAYRDAILDWRDAEAQSKYWRSLETTDMSRKGHLHHKHHDWGQIPSLEIPGILGAQMERRFGPAWGSFNFVKYGLWLFYPKLRTTSKWYGRRYGISKTRVNKNFNRRKEDD